MNVHKPAPTVFDYIVQDARRLFLYHMTDAQLEDFVAVLFSGEADLLPDAHPIYQLWEAAVELQIKRQYILEHGK